MNNLNVTNPTPLKRCPFCGGEAHVLYYGAHGKAYVIAACKSCVSRGTGYEISSFYTPIENRVLLAIEAWNRRV